MSCPDEMNLTADLSLDTNSFSFLYVSANLTESFSLKSDELTIPLEIHFSIMPDSDLISGELPVKMFVPFSDLSESTVILGFPVAGIIFSPFPLSLSPSDTTAK